MGPDRREGYAYLQVDRPIINRPTDFLSKVAYIALKVFGAEPIAAISETTSRAEELEDGSIELEEPVTRLVTVREPRVDVYNAEDLRLILLRKSVPIENSQKYNFNHKAAIFTAHQSHIPKNRAKSRKQRPTIREIVDGINTEYDLPKTGTPIYCDRIQDVGDIGNNTELALIPRVGQRADIVVRQQSKKCAEKLAEMSPSTMYPASPHIPFVPFLRIPEGVPSALYERFMDEIQNQNLLPVRLIMDGMDAHSGRRQVEVQSKGLDFSSVIMYNSWTL